MVETLLNPTSQARIPATTRITLAETRVPLGEDRSYLPAVVSAQHLTVAPLVSQFSPSTTFPQLVGSPTPLFTKEAIKQFCSPLQSIALAELDEVISAAYDPPPPGNDERHQGVDFAYYRRSGRASILGDGVQAVLGGTVAGVVYDRFPYGNMIIIETSLAETFPELAKIIGLEEGESLYLLYAHLEKPPSLQIGEAVVACQLLGTAGKSGNAGSAHLHLETRIGPVGARFPSMAYYVESASLEERAAYRLWRTSGTYRHLDPMNLIAYLTAQPKKTKS